MNQEYILLGGLLWKLWGKKIYMWRNHHSGSILTDIAAGFCKHVFCTSKFSYTAKYKKTVIMPVGIDTEVFKKITDAPKDEKSILFLARIAPVKKPHILVSALKLLADKGITFSAEIYGDPLPKDTAYYNTLKQSVTDGNLSTKISFHSGVPNTETVALYNKHDIFVNLSSSGMYDKTIFEAMACETVVLASNKNLHGLIGEEYIFEEENVEELAHKLKHLLALSVAEKQTAGKNLRDVVLHEHSLSGLAEKLSSVIS
jgi:glycosyltransferase involved in cell wall biosynthesis